MDNNDALKLTDVQDATVIRNANSHDVFGLAGHFDVKCFDKDGKLKWEDTIENTVMTLGANSLFDKFFDLAAAHSAVRMGLKGTGTPNIADTMASHGTWSELGGANQPVYSGNRPSPTFGAAAAGVKATNANVVFTITGTVASVYGCFILMSGSATKDDTTGTLFSAGDFTGGSKSVSNGDVLNVTWSLTKS